MHKDIRFYPWTIEKLGGTTTRVHHYKGYKCGLVNCSRNYPHAPVYTWVLQFPNGHCEYLDLAEANRVIFG
jgi:hypothetical protein